MKKIVIALLLALTFSISAFAEGITPITGLPAIPHYEC